MRISIERLGIETLQTDPLPEVSSAVLSLLLKEQFPPEEEVKDLVKLDASLSLQLLQLANSTSFGRPGQVASLNKVFQVLDAETIQDCLMSQVCRVLLTPKPSVVILNDQRLFWKHSLACARFCEMLSHVVGFPEPAIAYLAGLIHDFAKITLYQYYSQTYHAVFELMETKRLHLYEAESQVFDSNHATVGGKILSQWNVPLLLRQGIAGHHYPPNFLLGDKLENLLARIIQVGDILAYKSRQGDGGNKPRALADEFSDEIKPILSRLNPSVVVEEKDALEAIYSRVNLGSFNPQAYVDLIAQANRKLGSRSIELRTSLREITLLHQLHETFSISESLEDLLAEVAQELVAVLHAQVVAFLVETRRGEYIIYLASQQVLPDADLFRIKRELCTHFGSQAQTSIDPFRVPVESLQVSLVQMEEESSERKVLNSSAHFMLPGHDGLLGSLGVFSDRPKIFTPNEHDRFRVVADQIAMALDRLYLNLEARRMSMTDGLTGLYNHRQFQSFLEKEVQSAIRYQHPVSLLLLDLDFFKKINDKYGHLMGDQVLQELADLLRSKTRDTDLVARYGGEEFVVVLPKTPPDGASILAERICAAVRQQDFCKGMLESFRVTISIGVACFPASGIKDAIQLIETADKALYEAKNSGRDCVKIAPNEVVLAE